MTQREATPSERPSPATANAAAEPEPAASRPAEMQPLKTPAAFAGQVPVATIAPGPSSTASYCPSDWVKAMVTLPSRQSIVLPEKSADDTASRAPSSPDDTRSEAEGHGGGGRSDATRTAGSAIRSSPSAAASRWKRQAAMLSWTERPEAASDYILNEKIGGGGQGEVWRAWQTSLSREVAVKKLKSGDIAEFLMEAFTTAELDHPNIVPVHDLGRIGADRDEQPLLAMKLARGTPWNELIIRERLVEDFNQAEYLTKHLRILIDVCNAVAYAHSKNIIHRDLKPHQVMVGKFGEVFLMDWGLAVSLKEDALPLAPQGFPRRHTLLTATNQTGTPAYMAPEQTLEKTKYLGYHTDVYLLGAILYELVAGKPPHKGETASEAFRSACRNQYDPIPPTCPPELAEVVRKSLSTAPQERHATVEEFRDQVDAYLSGSTKRRESLEITEEIVKKLQGREVASLDYSELTNLRMKLERGLQYWPENPRGLALRDVLIAVYARRAIDAGDLRFAEYLIESLPDGHRDAEALREFVKEKRLEARREKRQRVIALGDYIIRRALGSEASSRPDKVAELRDTVENYLSGSNKRRDSQQISDEIGELFGEVGADRLDEAELLDAQRQLERAITLWPGNEKAKELLETAHAARARMALEAFDFAQAEALTRLLPEGRADRLEIESEIRHQRERQRRERRQRVVARLERRQKRWGGGLLIVLLSIVVFGFIFYKNRLEALTAEILEGQRAAEAEATEAMTKLQEFRRDFEEIKVVNDRAKAIFRAMATNDWQTLRTAPELEMFRLADPSRFEAMLRQPGLGVGSGLGEEAEGDSPDESSSESGLEHSSAAE
jgi:serine/threonine protein kinase